MGIRFLSVPGSGGGPITGIIPPGDLVVDGAQIVILYYNDSTSQWGWLRYLQADPIWTFGLAQASSRYFAALVSSDYQFHTGDQPPLPGKTASSLASMSAARLSFVGWPSVTAPVTVSGIVTNYSDPAALKVQLYTWSTKAGWAMQGAQLPITQVAGQWIWSQANFPAAPQAAAQLIDPASFSDPGGGILAWQGVLSTIFNQPLSLNIESVPPVGGGALVAGLLGLAVTNDLFAYVWVYKNSGDTNAAFVIQTQVIAGGMIRFANIPNGARYTVAVVTGGFVPTVLAPSGPGGNVVAVCSAN
jgi:hypothetical protein